MELLMKVKEKWNLLMVVFIKDKFQMDFLMVLENMNGLMELKFK